MKKAVEDKKMELTQAGMKIPNNDADVLRLFDTLELYGLINDVINKYNHRNTVQGCINDMVGNTNVPAVVYNSNEVIYTEQEEINNLNEDLCYLRSELRGNINDDDYKNSHDDSNLVDNGLNSNNTIGAHIVEDNLNTATIVDTNNKTTTSNKALKAKPIVVHENNDGAIKLAEAKMESTTPLVTILWKKRKGGSMDGLISTTRGTINSIHLLMRMNLVAHKCSRETTAFLN